MNIVPYDPRAIANLILDEADRGDMPITNLALQKLLYFAHAIFLIESKTPLVSGYFEAWKFGPVHPTAYQAFKRAKDRRIEFRAEREDLLTGNTIQIAPPSSQEICRHIKRITASYGPLTPGRLVEIAHAKDAPWHYIVSKGQRSTAFGLRITDAVIVDRFKNHKVAIGDVPILGEPREDTPLA